MIFPVEGHRCQLNQSREGGARTTARKHRSKGWKEVHGSDFSVNLLHFKRLPIKRSRVYRKGVKSGNESREVSVKRDGGLFTAERHAPAKNGNFP